MTEIPVGFGGNMGEIQETDEGLVQKRKHILVVDDDAGQLALIKENLSEFYKVTLVKSGSDCLKYLENHKPDLIFLDYMMPEMDGAQTLDKMRKTIPDFSIPVVFLTGVADRESIINTLVDSMPQGYMVKPATKMELVCKVIGILG